jgi:hypothetical protein
MLGGASPSVTRLCGLSERLSGFHGTIESEVQQRRSEEEQRLQLIRDSVVHLDKVLQVETKRRQESVKTLQMMLEQHTTQLQNRLQDELRESNEQLVRTIEALGVRVTDLEKQLTEERETRQRESEDASQGLTRQISQVQAAVENEKVARLEREAAILKRIGDDTFRLTEKIDGERIAREGATTSLRDEVETLDRQRQRLAERAQNQILEEIGQLRERIDVEITQREASEAQMCTTLDDIVSQVQSGITTIVSQTAGK